MKAETMDTDELTAIVFDRRHNCAFRAELPDYMTISEAKSLLADLASPAGWPVSTYGIVIGPRESLLANFDNEAENRKRAASDFAASWLENEQAKTKAIIDPRYQTSYSRPGSCYVHAVLKDTPEEAVKLAEQKLSEGYEVSVLIGKFKGDPIAIPGYNEV